MAALLFLIENHQDIYIYIYNYNNYNLFTAQNTNKQTSCAKINSVKLYITVMGGKKILSTKTNTQPMETLTAVDFIRTIQQTLQQKAHLRKHGVTSIDVCAAGRCTDDMIQPTSNNSASTIQLLTAASLTFACLSAQANTPLNMNANTLLNSRG